MVYFNVPVIGFVGRKNSGKSTCAEYLVTAFPCYLHPFAYRIKKVLMALGLKPHEINSRELRDKSDPRLGRLTVREFMQKFGTDFCRDQINQGIWVDHWLRDIKTHRQTVVVDDVRMENEAKAIRDMGGILIRINNPRVGSEDNHRSETESDSIECDLILVNDSSLENLKENLVKLLAEGKQKGSNPSAFLNGIGGLG